MADEVARRQNTVSRMRGEVYGLLGNPPYSLLSPSFVFDRFLDVIAEKSADLQLSGQNWLLQEHIWKPRQREIDVPIEASVINLVEVQRVDTSERHVWTDVVIISRADFNTAMRDGDFTCAFYANHKRMIHSFDPRNFRERILFEPMLEMPTSLKQEPAIAREFHVMLKFDVALLCLPYCDNLSDRKKRDLERTWQGKLGMWAEKWETFIDRSPHEGVTRKTAFNEERRSRGDYGWNNRMGWEVE